MQSVFVFLAFSCFCLEVHVYCNKICHDDEYTVVSSNGSFVKCFPCATCHPGWGLHPPCGKQLISEEMFKISCEKCPSGTFSAELDSSSCKNCQQCAPHEIASASCTRVSDTSCKTASKDSASESVLGSREKDSDENKGQDKNDVGVAVPRKSSLVRKLSKGHYQPLLGEDSDEQDEIVQEGVRGSSVPTIRFKVSKRKSSGAGTPNKEDFQDPKEDDDTKIVAKPFKVVVQPRHQEQKEGSRVKFECNISGETEVRYQWFKDDSTIQGQRNSCIVLDPVKVKDFGNYKCEVKYDDGDSEKCVTSLPAELDVIPSDGMKLKCLTNVDPNIQEKVGNLLTKKKPGIRTWKQLAIKYAMEDHLIVSLENSQETAGREVIEFLAKSNPKLTVYEVCKELKEKDIRRLDIVEVLLAHLSAPISGGDVRL